ncbi:hypothetical protein [Vibrio apostichopi]|uniref:hypothetical protein n=1 Tax=Vibrio apostichopi TaxID=3035453 RepID=UPI00257269B3|nr:hypothetical protein [Vibrio sp. FE10]
MINNIDVTLRDGGYQNNFNFSLQYAITHVKRVADSQIEWIEIGYRNGSFKPISNIGITGRGENEYIREIHNAVPHANLCMIAHAHNISYQDIDEMKEAGVGMLRLCLNASSAEATYDYVQYAKQRGFKVCVNATRVSQLSITSLVELAWKAEMAGADVFYLADSNGSMTPESVTSYVSTLNNTTNMQIGFHAHDNLSLAMSNSIAAYKAGARFIDSSLDGMGKGSGNLSLESWISYINNLNSDNRYILEYIFEQLEGLKSDQSFSSSEHCILDMILGMKNLSVEYKSHPDLNNIRDIGFALRVAGELQKV